MFELPDVDAADRIADWVELSVAVEDESLSKAQLATEIEKVGGSEPTEHLLSDVWRYLEIRAVRYTPAPFLIEDGLIKRVSEFPSPAYIAMLLFSLYGKSEAQRTDPKIFERIAGEALGYYLHGPVYVFGWPPTGGVPAAIAARVKEAANLMKERFVENPGKQYKDRGVDIIAWTPFLEPTKDDHRSGQVVMLAQCAVGANWRTKTAELPLQSWTQYIHWASEPIMGFAVPRVIEDEDWHDVSCEVRGVVFDRIRLFNLLPNGIQDADLATHLDAWVGESQDA